MLVFWKIWCVLFSWKTRFEIRPFALLPTSVLLKIEKILKIFHMQSYTEIFLYFLLKILNTALTLHWNTFWCLRCYFWYLRPSSSSNVNNYQNITSKLVFYATTAKKKNKYTLETGKTVQSFCFMPRNMKNSSIINNKTLL